jgi:hypothetical protein
MSTQDVVKTNHRKTTSRRVKFGATFEDLEGRVLLSSVHHAVAHRAAHVRVQPVHHAKPASHTRVVTPTRETTGKHGHERISNKAIATTCSRRSLFSPRSMFNQALAAGLRAPRARRTLLQALARTRSRRPAQPHRRPAAGARRIPRSKIGGKLSWH